MDTDDLTALRVTLEGPVTSFRYPFFAQGVHPTLELPPPATVHGLICSVAGDWIDKPATVCFGYTFTHQGKFEDYEHLHFFGEKPKMNPFVRHLLFEPRLTLYLDYPDLDSLDAAFRSPAYTLCLGRSQDLMNCTEIKRVELQAAEQAYFEGTLLPPNLAPYVDGATVIMTLARFVDHHRVPSWDQYALLRGRARFPTDGLQAEGAPQQVWVDPEVREWAQYPELSRGVCFHSFVGEAV